MILLNCNSNNSNGSNSGNSGNNNNDYDNASDFEVTFSARHTFAASHLAVGKLDTLSLLRSGSSQMTLRARTTTTLRFAAIAQLSPKKFPPMQLRFASTTTKLAKETKATRMVLQRCGHLRSSRSSCDLRHSELRAPSSEQVVARCQQQVGAAAAAAAHSRDRRATTASGLPCNAGQCYMSVSVIWRCPRRCFVRPALFRSLPRRPVTLIIPQKYRRRRRRC